MLLIRVLAAHNLVNADWFSLSDPYAKAPTGIDLVDLYRWLMFDAWDGGGDDYNVLLAQWEKRNKHHIHYELSHLIYIYIYHYFSMQQFHTAML